LTEGDAARRALRVDRALLIRPLCNHIAGDNDNDRNCKHQRNGRPRNSPDRDFNSVLITTMAAGISGSDPFESLPYFDDDLQKYHHLEALVDKELARELKASQTLHPSIPPIVEPYTVREHTNVLIFIYKNFKVIQ